MHSILICDDSRVDEIAPLCEERGLGIEVQAFYHPSAIGDSEKIAHHKERIANIPIRSLHGPFGDLCFGSFDPMVRDVARQRFEQAYGIARALGVTHIVLHHGYVPGTSGREGWIRRCAAFWNEFMEGKSTDVRIHLENLLEWEPTLLADVLEAVDHPNVDAILDIGHVHCNARASLAEWIEVLGTRIGYVHLHDNHGERDEHLGLGRGNLPVLETCRALEQHAPDALWAIEAEGDGISESLEWLDRHGFL